MKRYLFFATGDLDNNQLLTYLINSVSDVTMTSYLKYKIQKNFILIHFGSDLDFKMLQEYFQKIMKKHSLLYFLSECNDKMSSSLSEKDMVDFLILDGDPKEEDVLSDEDKELVLKLQKECFDNFFMAIENPDELFSEFDNQLDNSPRKKVYSLDEILDKINEKGVSSLTKEEKEFLNSLSK